MEPAPGPSPRARAAPRGGRRAHARAALAALLLGAFAPGAGRAEEVLRVSGTGSALGVMRRLGTAFERVHPGLRVSLLPSVGSGGALKAVSQGALDLGLSGRPLAPAEQALGLVATPFARTPFVLAAGPRSGATGLTARELARIYRGELTAWPNGERIRLVLRPASDVDTQLLASLTPELAEAVPFAQGRDGLLVATTNQECNAVLARTPGSLGPTTLSQLVTEEHALTPLAWEGVAPTLRNLAAGTYPLWKTLHVAVRAPPTPAVQRFLTWLRTPEAARILEQSGCLPAAPEPPR